MDNGFIFHFIFKLIKKSIIKSHHIKIIIIII